MLKPKVLVFTGYGLNTEMETKYSFELAGATADIVHVNDVIEKKINLKNYQLLAFTGGFSYGDDTGSGNALANRIRNHIWDQLQEFIAGNGLVIAICNGFQVVTNLGLMPALDKKYGEKQVALLHNTNARYTVRWVDLEFSGNSPWIKNMQRIPVPIAHGEGNFFAEPSVLEALHTQKLIAAKYVEGEICAYQNLPANPNGSLENIAAITDTTGRFLGMMPHPERGVNFTHLPNWPLLKERYLREHKEIPSYAPALQIFKNGVEYFL